MDKYVTHGKYFSEDEVRCKCGCGVAKADFEFMALLDALRRKLNRPLQLTSFYRCPQHDAEVGGTGNHTTGAAADIYAPSGRARAEIIKAWTQIILERNKQLRFADAYPEEKAMYRIGIGQSFIHVDNVAELDSGELRPDNVVWLYK